LTTPVKVPVGISARHWRTRHTSATVLLVAHNIATLNRLADIAGVFDGDLDLQIVATSSMSDPFTAGLQEAIADWGLVFVPWDQAVQIEFDLIVAASHHGSLTDLSGPIVIFSHGIGYTKFSPGAEGRHDSPPAFVEPGAGSREPGAGSREVFGLSRHWLVYDGRPVASAFVLGHAEQLERMQVVAPEAVPAAVVAGDPCYDRLLASRAHRTAYRRRLDITDDRTVVLVSSTWSASSLWGSWPELIERLGAELPADSYQLIAVLHPNVVQGHGEYQIRSWLAGALRAGLILIPPEQGWQAALIAADLVIGDHGSVTAYAAALGKAVLLGAFPDDEVAPGTAVHRLGQIAARLDRQLPLRPQIDMARQEHRSSRFAEVARLASSDPGAAADQIRALFYDVLGRSEPHSEALTLPYTAAGLAPAGQPRLATAMVSCATDATARLVNIERFAAEPVVPRAAAPGRRTHLAVNHAYPGRRLRGRAEVLTAPADEIGDIDTWLRDALDDGPHLLAAATSERFAALRHRRFGRLEAEADGDIGGEIIASAVLAWLDTEPLPDGPITIEAGPCRVRILVQAR
jgi:hypothetical protein